MELRVKYVFGPELRAERERRHLTQEEAAAQVGVSTRAWQLWETDGTLVPRAKHRRALIKWLTGEEAAA
jgi:transcriptional regulator with XRE-family HTH domain